jgi:hypothetical protein
MVQSLFSFHNRATLSELLKLAWPVVLARLGIMTMGLTDAIVVGHYASRELAYHSLAWAPSSVVLTTAVGLMMGVQVMTARLLGEGRGDEVGAVLRRGMTYAPADRFCRHDRPAAAGAVRPGAHGAGGRPGRGRDACPDGLRPVDAGLSDFDLRPVLP